LETNRSVRRAAHSEAWPLQLGKFGGCLSRAIGANVKIRQ
jgi:hypothetical protein